jgi:membrane associated rhomboid family serine protease
MAFSDRSYAPRFSLYFPQGVKWLLIVNIALFVVYYFARISGFGALFAPFALVPGDVLRHLAVWQFVTYMFLHDPYGFGHILFNMLTLWMFGMQLERDWGTERFLKYYFLCGVGAGICVVIANLLFSPTLDTRTIGASGAIYGLLLAFGVLYPNQEVWFSFLFPIKAKYFVMILGAIAFMSSFGASGGGVSHMAHLGGMIFGYAYIRGERRRRAPGRSRRSFDPIGAFSRWYHDFKLQRARRKFEVYMRKRQSDRDPRVH